MLMYIQCIWICIVHVNINYRQMRGQGNKENSVPSSSCSLQTALYSLQEELSRMRKEYVASEHDHASQTQALKAETKEYKRKLAQLSEQYIISTLVHPQDSVPDTQLPSHIHAKDLLIQDHLHQITLLREENGALKLQIQQLTLKNQSLVKEKEKSMHIGIVEKISLEEKIKGLELEIASKNNIMSNFKREIEKTHQIKNQTAIKERKIRKQSRELQNISKELQEYSDNYEKKFQKKIQKLQKQNKFLKNRIKKFQQFIESKQGNNEQIMRENLFQLKRQLNTAKIEINKTNFLDKRVRSKSKHKIQKSNAQIKSSSESSDDNHQ